VLSLGPTTSLLGIVGVVAGVVVSSATLIGFFGARSWTAELASHFRVQYLALLAALAVIAAATGHAWWAVVFAAFALVNAAVIARAHSAEPVAAASPSTPVRVFLSNLHAENGRFDLLIDAVRRSGADVVVLLEVRPRWIDELMPLASSHPFAMTLPRDDNFGLALYSKHPLGETECVHLGREGSPSLVAEIRTTPPLRVVATHPYPPLTPNYAVRRNEQLEALARFVRTAPRPLVLLGDLNTTPWSPYFPRLLADAGLRDSMRGRRPQSTWPVWARALRLPLDHCLVSSGIRVVGRRVGPDVGSDHFPVIVDLEIAAAQM